VIGVQSSRNIGAALVDLRSRRAIVTGGAAGIGAAISRTLASAGARVALADVDAGKAHEVASELGAHAQGFAIDVRERRSVERCFQEVSEAFGGYDIVCANAGVSTMRRVVDLTDEEWDLNFDVNARGVFLCNQIAVRHFLEHNIKGVIVNTASLAAKSGAPLLAHYSASKFAVVGFTQGLAREVAGDGIRVNCVCPGFVRTAMQSRELEWEASLRSLTTDQVLAEYVGQTPLGRIEEPQDVANAVLYLASDLSGFVTGEALNVTGGVRMD
jgi:NAD(P)-dependent dehydrogenase (short-subunit alcohol dehydrogenase family)